MKREKIEIQSTIFLVYREGTHTHKIPPNCLHCLLFPCSNFTFKWPTFGPFAVPNNTFRKWFKLIFFLFLMSTSSYVLLFYELRLNCDRNDVMRHFLSHSAPWYASKWNNRALLTAKMQFDFDRFRPFRFRELWSLSSPRLQASIFSPTSQFNNWQNLSK